jgi:hypothetical protein
MAKHKFTEGQLVRLEHRNSVWWYPAYCAEWWESYGRRHEAAQPNLVVQFTSAGAALVLPMPRHMRRSSDNQHWIKILFNDRAVYIINNCLVPVG